MPNERSPRAIADTFEWAIRRTGINLPAPVFHVPTPLGEEVSPAPAAEQHQAVIAATLTVLTVLAFFYTLFFARAVVLPVVIAVLVSFLLRGPVRWLKAKKIGEPLGAAVVVFGSALLVVVSMGLLAGPASSWIERAPNALVDVERKLRTIAAPVMKWEATAARVGQLASGGGTRAPVATAAPPSRLMMRAFGGAANFLFAGMGVMFLSYFLLASGDLFMRKLMKVLPYRAGQSGVPQQISDEVSSAVSAYLRTTLLINTALGLATWGLLELLGMPNAGLWGTMAGLLNVIPYLGAFITAGVLAAAALTVFDSAGQAMLVPGAFILLNIIESNIVTPLLMGRQFPLNTVALFIGVMLWGFVWGIPGAILAVPIMVTLKILFDHIPALHTIAEFLGQ